MTDSARAAGPGPSETRPLFVVAFGPSLVTLASALVVGAIVLLSAGTDLAALVPTVAGLWLAVHQVPVTISDITLGVLPLVPTVALVWGAARAARRAGGEGRPLAELRSVLLCAIAGPALFTAISLAVVNDAAGRFTISTPSPLTAFLCTLAVHLGGALLGLAPAYWPAVVRYLGLPGWVTDSARLAGTALLVFFGVGLAIVLVRLIWQWQTVFELVRSGNDAVGMVALVVLSLLYLPNVVIAAAALPLGVSVQLGPISMSLFSAAPGRAPGIPILAVLPQGESPWYLLPLLAVPAAVAIWIGRRCASRTLILGPTVASVATTALFTAAGFTVAAFAAGGTLGGFGYAGVDLPQLFGFTFAWIALIGVLAALVLQQFGDSQWVRAARRADEHAASGYTTYADEDDVVDDRTAAAETVEIVPADRDSRTGATDEVTEELTVDPDDGRSGPADDEADTGDFDAVADQPTSRVRQARGARATNRDRAISDIEELDSYTFGQ
ncbi:Integral membrane protein OS=Tsukamurella paurometabola (strain ATCC 8368 / DSM / CCUG 35730/ CIP 100753 / JCM 10117 / KCTC 9821 / NBRC 16120 / NCIMB 702349/ NCTC 13040) OX=521096 GN=Tpau_3306 PE=4 SV=1 [Tsukamurella paurometabola]|uniref:Uncharacterized protein n=1 Tax=Tsukamurella paurometabola (strain ATCC 8368 / DSM 20162 / CCUG 35730 / CIP 100753 / JCM 10117 / KCTC 9821 / NBRC 16120 / NCIMB 702349 / NCTC 13040) TaxID=521096 RepID=D5UW92_TSUPD|nr:DUF6350 family protein [Tsukamurella paurometabola]ADG79891.1 conserved hypothetical protein [Tsukamurella paurometabola DSM 20162]SUP37549.1 Uncharacterised protein [Tsukamurella paurometabola]